MGYPSHRPRCLHPMEYRGPAGDPDPVCWRPEGHDAKEPPTKASLRHLSRRAYLNELARNRKSRRQWAR